MQSNTTRRRFSYKLDLVFWFIVMMLPIIVYFITSFRNPEAVGFLTFVADFSPFPFIEEILHDVFALAFGCKFELSGLLAYFVGVEIFHVLFDVIVFIPRLAHKWISKAVQDDGYDSGYSSGRWTGYDEGYNDGYEDGLSTSDGYDKGYDAGHTAGKSEGYNDGYDKGYDAGHTAGKSEGYDDGYSEGLAAGTRAAMYGIFANATFDAVFTYVDDQYYSNEREVTITGESLEPYLIYSAVDFQLFYNRYEDYMQGYDLQEADFTIRFNVPFSYSLETYPFLWQGSSIGVVFTLIGTDGLQYSYSLGTSRLPDGVAIPFPIPDSSFMVSSISVGFAAAYNTMTGMSVFASASSNYYGGYSDGFNSGYESGRLDGYFQGVDSTASQKYQEGYSAGYSAGLNVAEKGDFFNLFSALIDAPVSVFSSLLNFDILGFNMRNLVLSLLSVALVISAIRLFSGGA